MDGEKGEGVHRSESLEKKQQQLRGGSRRHTKEQALRPEEEKTKNIGSHNWTIRARLAVDVRGNRNDELAKAKWEAKSTNATGGGGGSVKLDRSFTVNGLQYRNEGGQLDKREATTQFSLGVAKKCMVQGYP